ncbi:MAG TPA: polyprenyl synthetase family protein [Gammaproteobacteria bacterium]|nr:polyprenyl synthetase family protein [Gammaproteobacteria bacterium]
MNATDLKYYSERIEIFLNKNLVNTSDPLHQAMRYSVLNGGKRLRPLLVYAAGLVSGADLHKLDHCAAAVEFIHAYSLIHDDLPAMDDDDFRRGMPSCHKKFGEATAILAGDALQSLAFEILAENNNPELIKILARAVGTEGMVLGQSMDMQYKQKDLPEKIRETIHKNKTAKLIMASVQLGALTGTISEDHYKKLVLFAEDFGLAFQYHDDAHDGEENCLAKAEFFYKKAEGYLASLSNTELFFRILAMIKSNNNVSDNANH